MKLSCIYAVALAAHASAIPTSIKRQEQTPTFPCIDDGKSMIPPVSDDNPADPKVGLPIKDRCGNKQAWVMPREICEDRNVRGPKAFTETYRTGMGNWPAAANMASWFETFAGGSYVKEDTNGGPEFSVLAWAAQYDRANFDLQCNVTACALGDGTIDECKEDYINSQVFMVLESSINFFNFLKSLTNSISNCKNFIADQLPQMYNTFGLEEVGEDPPAWDKIIGMMSAGVGVYGALAATATAGVGGALFGLAGSFATFLLPEAPKEQKFLRAANAVAAFTSNTEVILGTVDSYIKKQFVDPVTGPKGGKEINDFLKDPASFVQIIKSGEFAGRAPPVVADRDPNILSALAAPIINEMWSKADIFVAKFPGPSWRDGRFGQAHEGKDLCHPDLQFYDDLQPDGRICDPDGSLYLILHWSKGGVHYAPSLRETPGMRELADFKVTRKQIIDGSVANSGKWFELPDMKKLTDRLTTVKTSADLGKLNIWTLPYCVVDPSKTAYAYDIEEFIAISTVSCITAKDKEGADWPYKPDKTICTAGRC